MGGSVGKKENPMSSEEDCGPLGSRRRAPPQRERHGAREEGHRARAQHPGPGPPPAGTGTRPSEDSPPPRLATRPHCRAHGGEAVSTRRAAQQGSAPGASMGNGAETVATTRDRRRMSRHLGRLMASQSPYPAAGERRRKFLLAAKTIAGGWGQEEVPWTLGCEN